MNSSIEIDSKTAVLTAEGLCKNYGRQQVLKDLNLVIRPGCIYGLIGRNGAGKTTLLSILSGQNPKTAGLAAYGGQPVWENRAALRHLCFARELSASGPNGQNPLKVRDYLRAGAAFYPLWDAEYAQRLVQKFALDPKKGVGKLSKGQQSMVSIVLALASRAPITLLDEPTAGLDVVAREQFYQLLLADYAETGRAFVISTHIIEEAAGVFERVMILDGGSILADSPTEELLQEFRYVSGPDEALDAAVLAAGGTICEHRSLGAHKIASVRGSEAAFAALAENPALSIAPMSLQNVFVALCGHGDTEV